MLSYWDTVEELKTSSMLLAPTLSQHYLKLKEFFNPRDIILDVGCGTGTFEEYFPNATGVDEKTDLMSANLSVYNTLFFAESVGYIDTEVIERLISTPNINKVVLKDFLSDRRSVKYFNYDFTTLKYRVLPLLEKYGYSITIIPFMPNMDRWKSLLAKYDLEFISYDDIRTVIVLAHKMEI